MSNSLGPAFSYSPSPTARHQPSPSDSSFASLSTSASSTRSSSTSYTSSYCSYEEEEEEEDDHGSVLEDLYELANSNSESSPPRLARDSSQQLRERTRYRSSASIHPPAQLAQSRSSRPLPNSSMDFAALLASLPPSLDTCFCGQAVEEDSIYCSRRCAQEDALNALCGASSGAEDSDRASLVSGSSGSTSQSGESHYRRVEREEVRREKERQAKMARERSAARRKAREGASVSSMGSSGSKKGSLWRSNVDVGSVKASTSTSSGSSRRAETPSLSSSISSLSSASSPISPSFPPSSTSTCSLSHPTPIIVGPTEPPRPTTPSPPSHLQEMNDIYSSYLTTTPLAPSSESKHLRTPTQQFGIRSNSTPRSTYPQTPFDEDDEDESPTGRAARLRAEQQGMSASCGVSDVVGMRMLQLCSSYPSSPSDDLFSESLDHVQTEAPSLGWGHRAMQERMNGKQGRSGHTKGKLSFEDVVGILGA